MQQENEKVLILSGADEAFFINKKYKYWRKRILASIIIGYAMFYFLRQNFSVVTVALQDFFNISKTEIGAILTLHATVYGIGKGIWSIVSDKSNARLFMPIGLLGASLANIITSFSGNITMIGICWAINGCFLSMGAAPCIKLITYWFTKNERATKWALWNASQQIGAASTVLICSHLLIRYGWRTVFLLPGILGIFMAIFLLFRLRDTPKSIGLPTIEDFKGIDDVTLKIDETLSMKEIIFKKLIKNKILWLLCLANLFFYLFRMGILNWAPTFLMEFKGNSQKLAGFQTSLMDISSVCGGIFAGYISDKVLHGKRTPLCILSMLLLASMMFILLYIPQENKFLQSLVMSIIGVLITAPQILVGVAATDFSSKKIAGTANGLTGSFGYLGASIAGIAIGTLAEGYGWHSAFGLIISSALVSALLFFVIFLTNKWSSHKNLSNK